MLLFFFGFVFSSRTYLLKTDINWESPSLGCLFGAPCPFVCPPAYEGQENEVFSAAYTHTHTHTQCAFFLSALDLTSLYTVNPANTKNFHHFPFI